MPKNKSHKGLLKRVRVTKNGKIKLHRAYGRHLRSHKSASKIRSYRIPKYASGADARRLRSLLLLKINTPSRAEAASPETPTPSQDIG
jgi:large subunit ribosomal protein L35